MKKEIKTEDIQKQLKRVVESKTFSRSDSNQRLLIYLVEATLKDENPKEYTIGVDVFNRAADESSNSNVRVYIHKLRKRLEKYYIDEGAEDPIYFNLPTGSYNVEFSNKKPINDKKNYLFVIILLLVFLNVATLIFYQFRKTPLQKLLETKFWSELIENRKPTVLIAGDYFFYTMKMNATNGVHIRDPFINSKAELKQYANINNLDYSKYNFVKDLTYMPRDALFSMPNLIPLLEEGEVNYEMIVCSDFDWKLFKDQNLVYIGSMKNLKEFGVVFEKLDLEYKKGEEQLQYQINEEKKEIDILYNSKSTIDATVVIRIPGPGGNIIHMFVSNHDLGCISSTEFFTDLENVQQFEKEYLENTPYFVGIFKAEGFGRADFSIEPIDIVPFNEQRLKELWH